MSQRAFLFDLNRCTGCQACAIGCGTENYPERLGAGPANWRQVQTFNEIHLPGLTSFSLSLACNHCVEPACMKACPAQAYTKDPSTGAVLVHADLCIGCKYCTWACPYDAPRFDRATRTIQKCTFCNHRLAAGGEPACVTACPTGALAIGDHRDDGASDGAIGFAATDLQPAIRFVALRNPAVRMEGEHARAGIEPADIAPAPSKITLRGEWPLFVFTSVVFTLVALFVAAELGRPWPTRWLLPGFVAAGSGVLLLSTWHLGHRRRAWRAGLNWRTSWLSREVLLVPSFLGLACAWLLASRHLVASTVMPAAAALRTAGWLVALVGLAAVFAVDRVYSVIVPAGRHGAMPRSTRRGRSLPVGPALGASLYLAGLQAGVGWLWLPAGIFKAVVYVPCFSSDTRRRDTLFSVLREGVGFVAPMTLLAFTRSTPWTAVAFALGLAGELVERAQFYDRLQLTTPHLEMQTALRSWLASRAPSRQSRSA